MSDYEAFLSEHSITQADMDAARSNVVYPTQTREEYNVYFAPSKIEGFGTFADTPIPKGGSIAPLVTDRKWTLTGMMTNHSGDPNAELNDHHLVALRDISQGDEVTVNYRKVKEAF